MASKLALRVAARFIQGMEFPTEKALKDYLHEHPGADKSKHTVDKKPGKSKGPSKVDSDLADREAQQSAKRKQEVDAEYSTMKELKQSVENDNPSAKKKFDRAYTKLYHSGESAHKAADKLLKKYKDSFSEGSQEEAALELLQHAKSDWERVSIDHARKQDKFTHEKFLQAEQTHGYASQLEKRLSAISKVLKDPEAEVD